MKCCDSCGEQLADEATFCINCGKIQEVKVRSVETESTNIKDKVSNVEVSITKGNKVVIITSIVIVVFMVIAMFMANIITPEYEKVAKKYIKAIIEGDVDEMSKCRTYGIDSKEEMLVEANVFIDTINFSEFTYEKSEKLSDIEKDEFFETECAYVEQEEVKKVYKCIFKVEEEESVKLNQYIAKVDGEWKVIGIGFINIDYDSTGNTIVLVISSSKNISNSELIESIDITHSYYEGYESTIEPYQIQEVYKFQRKIKVGTEPYTGDYEYIVKVDNEWKLIYQIPTEEQLE